MIDLPVRRLEPAAGMPARAHPGDAGLDLVAVEHHDIAPGERATVRTGLAVELPPGHAGLVVPRSGLAARHGVTVLNAPGLVDAGYRGDVRVILLNTDRRAAFAVRPGDRIAQLVVVALPDLRVVEVDALTASARGAGGLGSTGP